MDRRAPGTIFFADFANYLIDVDNAIIVIIAGSGQRWHHLCSCGA
jgi:hypothetical protein